jgi:membrane-bound ClpP family serine protease
MTLAILLLGLGLALIVAEVLFPSMGILGALATIAIVAGAYVAFKVDGATGARYLIATAVMVPVFILGGFRLLPKSPLARQLMARGFTFEDGRATDSRDAGLLGMEGVVEAPLRPAGVARLDGRRVDVVSRGSLIDPGTPVRVIELQGNRVVVAPITESTEDHPGNQAGQTE